MKHTPSNWPPSLHILPFAPVVTAWSEWSLRRTGHCTDFETDVLANAILGGYVLRLLH